MQKEKEETIFEGFIYKRGEFIKNWRRRFFVLTDRGNIYGYKEKHSLNDGTPYLNNFNVNSCVVIATNEPKKHCIVLRFMQRGVVIERLLRCKNEEEQLLWVNVLKNVSTENKDSVKRNKNLKNQNQNNINQYEFIAILGKGRYSKVTLAKPSNRNDEAYAIKVLNKQKAINQKRASDCSNEYNLSKKLNFEFIVRFYTHIESPDYYYIVMEYLVGGDLFNRLKKEKTFKEDRTRLYIAEVVLALEYLHLLKIVYSDLKLENLMIDDEGHIKLVDFDCCKVLNEKFDDQTIIGTDEYVAPEIIKGLKVANFQQDWWALGIITYECLHGQPPFVENYITTLYDQICFKFAPIAKGINETTKSFIEGLLEKDPKNRLGGVQNDFSLIKKHKYFSEYTWDDVLNRRIKPQYVPKVQGIYDKQNFEWNKITEASFVKKNKLKH